MGLALARNAKKRCSAHVQHLHTNEGSDSPHIEHMEHYQVLMLLLIQHGRSLHAVKKQTAAEGKTLSSVMIPHLSLHPNTFISLPHILHLIHALSFSPPILFLVCFFFTDYRQSSHAVHLLRFRRRPSESPNPHSHSAQPLLRPF